MTEQASIALQSAQFVEQMQKNREEERKLLDVVSEVTAEIDLPTMLSKVMGEATKMLNADRSSIFLNDPKTNELWLQIGDGLESTQIRFPNHLGIAGTVFTSGETINIPHAYADLRFNPDFDKQTGYFTRSILCVPIINKDRVTLGVTQVLNKRGGPFTEEDEQRLKAFTAQISVGLENAQLFADVQNMKNYNDTQFSLQTGLLTEPKGFLGSSVSGAYGNLDNSDTLFSGLQIFHESDKFYTTGSLFYGKTDTNFKEQGLISNLEGVKSSSFSLGLFSKKGFGKHDSFGIQIDQPLRLEEGRMDLSVPVARTKYSQSIFP